MPIHESSEELYLKYSIMIIGSSYSGIEVEKINDFT
jgi:hypothetical protein